MGIETVNGIWLNATEKSIKTIEGQNVYQA